MPIAKLLTDETESLPTLIFEGVPVLDAAVSVGVAELGFLATDETVEVAQATLLRQLGEAYNRVFGDKEVLAQGQLANSLTDLTELTIDPRRAGRPKVGVTVRASFGGRYVDADVAHLTKDSLLAWLRSRGHANPFAEDLIGFMLGHGALTDREGSPLINLGIPMGVAVASLVEIAGLGPLPEAPKPPAEVARDCLDRLGITVEMVPGAGSMVGPGNGEERPS